MAGRRLAHAESTRQADKRSAGAATVARGLDGAGLLAISIDHRRVGGRPRGFERDDPALGAGALSVVVADFAEALFKPLAFVSRRIGESNDSHRRELGACPYGAHA